MADQTGAVDRLPEITAELRDALRGESKGNMRIPIPDLKVILRALERIKEVTQGCEFCGASVGDWRACKACWNESARRATDAIGHFSDLLDRAQGRIPELERRLDEAIDQNMRQAGRLERLEAAAWRLLDFDAPVTLPGELAAEYLRREGDLRAALAPTPEGSDGE